MRMLPVVMMVVGMVPLTSVTAVAAVDTFSYDYADGQPTEITVGRYTGAPPASQGGASVPIKCSARTQRTRFESLSEVVHVYASFLALPANPMPYVDGQPSYYQTITLGQQTDDEFVPAVRFGIVDDDRASSQEKGNYTPGGFDGSIEYYGMYCRPRTTYDFKLKLDLSTSRVTTWVSGRGDDQWFPLMVAVPLMNSDQVTAINAVRVDQLPEAAGINNLVLRSTSWPEGEQVRPHQQAKRPVVRRDGGFKFQAMRSLWRRADRHVTVARTPNAEKGWWLGFPDIVQTGPQTLVCVHNNGPAHGGGGSLLARRSFDLGKTWSEAEEVSAGPTNCPRVQQLSDGSLLAVADTTALPFPNRFFGNTKGTHQWTQLGTLDPKKAGGRESCVPSRVIELDDGSWLCVGSHTPGKAWQVTAGELLEINRSTDRGQSWKLYSTLVPSRPRSICEASIVPLPDGRFVLFARESGSRLPGVKAFSSDKGKTWGPLQDLPFYVQGRTCAGLLNDGRVMLTFRADWPGPRGLWAWVGDPDEETVPLVCGVHINDRYSVGLKETALYIDSDGQRGQFTQYEFAPPDDPESTIEITAELKVLANHGRAATVSVPFVGKLRIFSDHVELAHQPSLRAAVDAEQFHIYHVVSDGNTMSLSIDSKPAFTTDQLEKQQVPLAWSPLQVSHHALSFGNEMCTDDIAGLEWSQMLDPSVDAPVLSRPSQTIAVNNVTPAVTGTSLWRRFRVRIDSPASGLSQTHWQATDGVFPDQYQLDHLIEIQGTIAGNDQGYSGWVQFPDERIFVVNYTDDTARWNRLTGSPLSGVSWIRGTNVLLDDLPKP